MRVGTRSVLFGAHSFPVHFLAVFLAWIRLFGFPWDPRLWIAFAVHDLGYVRRSTVEGAGSEQHVELGGRIMTAFFGDEWGSLCYRHSRYWCRLHGQPYSRLCVADKLAFVLTPAWLYLPMARASGELSEYMAAANGRQAGGKFTAEEMGLLQSPDAGSWLRGLKSYTARWVEQHRNRGTWGASHERVKKQRQRVSVSQREA